MADKSKLDSSGSSLSSTRQLLDELDALMQRMLALPVGDTAEEARQESDLATTVAEPPTEAAEDRDEPAETPARKSAGYQYDEAEGEQPSEAVAAESEVPFATDEDDAAEEEPATAAVSSKLKPVAEEVLASLAARPGRLQSELLTQHSRLLAGRAERTPLWLLPLSLPSRIFDLCTYLLGPLGSWLRSPGGRTFLGVVGILLLLAAVGLHLLTWLSWN